MPTITVRTDCKKCFYTRNFRTPAGYLITEHRETTMARDVRDLTDEELLIRCKRAGPEAARNIIGIIAERYQRPLFNYLCKMVASDTLAEDLLQEAYLRLFRHRKRYRKVAKCSTWLYRIATNLALNAIRDRKKHAHYSLSAPRGDDGGDYSSLMPSDAERPEEMLARKDLQGIVRTVLQEIPEKYRAVIVLCDVEGLSYAEAAETLDIAIGTVRSRLSRAREGFQKRFAPYMKELETR